MYALYGEYICASSGFGTFYRRGATEKADWRFGSVPLIDHPLLYTNSPQYAIYMLVMNVCSFLRRWVRKTAESERKCAENRPISKF